jgi:acyl-CoA synthetase (AMP-forming)/AMP-acid ligase II
LILDEPALIEHWKAAGWWGRTTVYDLFRDCVQRYGDRLALVDPPNRESFTTGEPRQLTFAETARAVDELGVALFSAGVRRGDIVLVQLPNVVEIVIAFLAGARLGAIVSPIMLAYGERDLRRIVQHLHPAAWVTLAAFKELRPARRAADVVAAQAARGEGGARPLPVLAFGSEHDARVRNLEACDHSVREIEGFKAYVESLTLDANEIVTMHWTSGTTGEPKCVPRSHNTWHATGSCCTDAGGLEPGERILAPMQMVHTAGYSGMFMPWLETAGLLALHQPFDMRVFLEQIETLRINHTVAAPAMLNALLKSDALEARDVSSIRSILCGSAPLDPWMIEGFKQRYGIEIVNAFGSTEGLTLASGPSISADPYRRARYFPRFRGRAERSFAPVSWGLRIAPVVETRLRDLDTGRDIEVPRQPGELLFRSPALFPGYWTAAGTLDRSDFDERGFFRAGEIFEIAGEDADSDYLHYIDRLRDVINRGGVKIPVGEVESAIQALPEVREATVIGSPDARLGERICAVVVLAPDASLSLEGLIQRLEAAGIDRYLLPERLEIVPALPRNLTGKVLKRELARSLTTTHAT